MRTATSGATAPKGGGQRASCAACADEGPSRPPFLLFHAYHSGRSGIRGLGPVSSVIWSTVTLPAEPRHETNACAYRVPKFGLFLTWGDRQGAAVGVGVSRVRPPALPGLRPALRLAKLVPLGRSSAPKNAELLVLRHDVAATRGSRRCGTGRGDDYIMPDLAHDTRHEQMFPPYDTMRSLRPVSGRFG